MGGPPKKADATLGLMASHLDDLFKKDPSPKTLPKENTVRRLRDFAKLDRNPVIHPTSELDLEEIDAAILFNTALGVITEMAREMASLGSKTPSSTQKVEDQKAKVS